MTDEADYITLHSAVKFDHFCVCVMRYRRGQDDYTVARCSQPMRRAVAEALARSWAAAMRLEFR